MLLRSHIERKMPLARNKLSGAAEEEEEGDQLQPRTTTNRARRVRLTIVFGYFAGIHDEDAVAVDDGTESMGDDEEGLIAELFADGRLDTRVGRKVDRSRRFAAKTARRRRSSQKEQR